MKPHGPKRIRGSISLYLSLMLAVFLTFAGALCESVMIRTGKNKVRAQTQLALENVFAEYDPDLFEHFHVFAVDLGRYGGQAQDALRERMRFYGADTSQMETDAVQYMSDDAGSAFYDQVITYMKERRDSPAEELLSAVGLGDENVLSAVGSDGAEQIGLAAIEQTLGEAQALGTQLAAEAGGWQFFSDAAGALSPDPQTLMPEGRTVSGLAIDLSGTVSGRALAKGHGSFRRALAQPAREGTLYDRYVTEVMHDASDAPEEAVEGSGALDYESEYIIAGKDSDKENMKTVAGKIIAVRLVSNLACLSQDAVRMAGLEGLAAFVSAAVFAPELEPAVQKALMFAWAYAESVAEMRTLLGGGRVALRKTSDQWTVTEAALMTFITTGTLIGTQAREQEGGISYQDYLEMFLAATATDTKVVRTLDLVEETVNHHRVDGTVFKCDRALFRVRTESTCKLPRNVTYRFKTEFSYR